MRRSMFAVTTAVTAVALVTLMAAPAASSAVGAGHPGHRINKVAPELTLTLTPRHSAQYGGSLRASVRVAGAHGSARGEVDIRGVPGGDCEALDLVHGKTSCEADELDQVGPRTVVVVYHGSKVYRSAKTHKSFFVTRATTDMLLHASPASQGVAGEPVTFTVDLSDLFDETPTSGTVGFGTDTGWIHGCKHVPVDRHGSAACTTTLPAGEYTISFDFRGTSVFAPAQAGIDYTIATST